MRNLLERLNKRDKVALAVGALAVVLYLVLEFGVLAVFDQMPQQGGEIEEKELALQRYQRLVATAERERTRQAAAQERLEALEAGLLESSTPSLANAEWQRLVNELAESRGIQLSRRESLPGRPLGADYALVAGRVQFRCRLDQLVDFLVALGASPRLFSVSQMRVMALPNDPQKMVSVDLRVEAAVRVRNPEGQPDNRKG